MIAYSIPMGKTELITDEGADAIFYAKQAIENGQKSVFIEVREMSEKEFEALDVV